MMVNNLSLVAWGPRKGGNTEILLRERGAGNALKRKPGAAVIAVRRTGAIHALDSINHFFMINEMIIPGSSYWNIGIGKEKGDVLKDEEGLRTMKILGENMAWLLKKINK
jgi:multimeric flavodoxin WrbA